MAAVRVNGAIKIAPFPRFLADASTIVRRNIISPQSATKRAASKWLTDLGMRVGLRTYVPGLFALSVLALGGVEAQANNASWYGPGFQGRKTANGETFNTHHLTAAHKTLPFGTRVKVLNLNTGRAVVVRINDRGPFIRGRIIDLSHAAAKAIGMTGLARVALAKL